MKEISLTQGKFAIIDDEDFELVSKYKWYAQLAANGFWYAVSSKHPQIQMHRLILGLKPGDGEQVDHANRNSLDNQRCNIRLCTPSQNMANTKKYSGGRADFWGLNSKYKGVSRNRPGKWHVQIQVNGKTIHLGSYSDEMVAAQVYDDAARDYFGEFARCNFGEM